jgi:hypothetical protein
LGLAGFRLKIDASADKKKSELYFPLPLKIFLTANRVWQGRSFLSCACFFETKHSLGEAPGAVLQARIFGSVGRHRAWKRFAKMSISSKFGCGKIGMNLGPTNRCSRLAGTATLTICVSVFLDACSITPTPSTTVTHVVLMWLKNPESAADRAQLVRASRSLRMIPGVLQVQTGRTVPLPRAGVDQSFDLGVVITFRDRAALQRYEKDPRHVAAVRYYLRPLVRRYVVYNSNDR